MADENAMVGARLLHLCAQEELQAIKDYFRGQGTEGLLSTVHLDEVLDLVHAAAYYGEE